MSRPDRELEDWKSNINLVAFALSCGYQLDLQQSSRHSKVLRRESDLDKIVIATSEQGHWIYFSVRDPDDHGTVIDFIQRREKKNLGKFGSTFANGGKILLPIAQFLRGLIKPLPSCCKSTEGLN